MIKFCTVICALLISGCAALPMPFQPANQQYNSNMAEGAFIVLETVDTLQTMHLTEVRNPTTVYRCNHEADPIAAAIYGGQYPNKTRVLITNILLVTAHTMVASWLDDRVASESAKNDANEPNNLGPWYVGRVAFHAVSLAISASSVINNARNGCKL